MALARLLKIKLPNIIICAIIILGFYSCNGDDIARVSIELKNEADSLVRNVKDVDSLKNILRQYEVDQNFEGQMMTLKQLGKRQRELNDFIDAITSHTAGQEIATQLCDTVEIIQALNNIGTNYRRMSMLEDATTFHYRALKYCDEFSDKSSFGAKKNQVVSLNGIGNISLRLGDYVTADSVFRAALAGESELGSALGQAINYANLGAIFEYNNKPDSAWAYYTKSMEMNVKAKSDLGISLCHGYFGSLYEKEGNYNKAIEEYEKAYNMEGHIDTWHWLNSCLSLAQLHIKLNNIATATTLLYKAEKAALDGNSLDHLASIYSLLSDLSDKKGQTKQAFDFYKKSRQYNDSIVSEKNLVQIQNERVQYEYQRRQQEVDTLRSNYDQEKEAKTYIIWSMIAIVALSVVAIVLLLVTLRMKKKSHKALRQIDEVRSSFFTNITHEFRTPLTVIVGVGEQLKNKNLEAQNPDKIAEMGGMIARQGRNLLLLVNQILDITKMKSVTRPNEYRHGDIAGYIHTVVECTRELAKSKHISLLFSPSQSKIHMDFVPDYITKIITNLVANAIKFTPDNGRIYITADIEDDNLKLCVADNGCGMAREEIPYIFDVFYQGRKGRIESGSGIGLSLTKQLIESMNGTIAIHSAENEGSVFIITLPIKQGDEEWEHVDNELVTPPISYSDGEVPVIEDDDELTKDDKPVILVVEDNNDILTYIGSVINNAHIHYAHDGNDGLKKATDIIPDIIITDIMMPGMDGLEMIQQIRQSELLSHIPVVAITAKCSEDDKIKGVKAGINHYIYKPFDADELNATINNIIQLRHSIQEKFNRNELDSIVDTEADISRNDQAFLTKVIDIIYSQMSQHNVNPQEIASALCISTKQLNRKISAITGQSLGKYIIQVRMNKAKNLLDSNNGYTIAEVSQLCGYEENSNFTRVFKQVYGITPSQYNRRP